MAADDFSDSPLAEAEHGTLSLPERLVGVFDTVV